jgi:hypothetical protein
VKRAVNFNDHAEVADWLASVVERAYELADIATEATAPHGVRTLSKAALRAELAATFGELHQLARAGRRGIRAAKGSP